MGKVKVFTLKFITYQYIVYDCSATIWLHLLHFGTTTERVRGNTEDGTAVIEHWSAGCTVRLSAPAGGDSYAEPSVEYKYKSSRGNTEDGTAVTEHWSAGNGLWLHQAVRGCLS